MTMHEILDALDLAREQLEPMAQFDLSNGGKDTELHAALAAVVRCITDLKESDGVLD
jgi:hypothetical protein